MTKMVYRFNKELQTTTYEPIEYLTVEDVVNEQAMEWLEARVHELGLEPFGELIMSDYVELANYKFGGSDE